MRRDQVPAGICITGLKRRGDGERERETEREGVGRMRGWRDDWRRAVTITCFTYLYSHQIYCAADKTHHHHHKYHQHHHHHHHHSYGSRISALLHLVRGAHPLFGYMGALQDGRGREEDFITASILVSVPSV